MEMGSGGSLSVLQKKVVVVAKEEGNRAKSQKTKVETETEELEAATREK